MLETLLNAESFRNHPTSAKSALIKQFATVVGARAEPTELASMLTAITDESSRAVVAAIGDAGLGRGLPRAEVLWGGSRCGVVNEAAQGIERRRATLAEALGG